MSVVLRTPSSAPLDPRSAGEERLRAAGLPIRVIVADDEPIYQAGITYVLQMAGLEVVATTSNADDLARKTRAHHPEVAIVDADMAPCSNGVTCVQAAREMRSIEPGLAILILSQSADDRQVLEAMGDCPSGFGYLLKARIGDLEDFAASVRRIAHGGTAIDPTMVGRLAARQRPGDPLDELTPRALEVLELIAEGRSNRFIAEELVVTVAAVERHITSIFAKLRLSSNSADHRRVLAALRYLSGRSTLSQDLRDRDRVDASVPAAARETAVARAGFPARRPSAPSRLAMQHLSSRARHVEADLAGA
jgi:DNA-binding NarL/FixJ family response regulator